MNTYLTDQEMARLLARDCFDEVVIHDGALYVAVDDALLYRWNGTTERWVELPEPILVG